MGWTAFRMPERLLDTAFGKRDQENWLNGDATAPADLAAECAGRVCYDSYSLPNTATATNAGYLNNIIEHQHFSVLEHGMATFLVSGVSRSLLMEMRTHRHASFSARSTRYVDEADAAFILPPALRDFVRDSLTSDDFTRSIGDELDSLMEHATDLYSAIFEFAVAEGATRKEAREAAREVLPGATATEFVVSANHHAWREILQKRLAPGAAIEIRELSREILRQLKELAPSTYQDISWS